MGAQIEFSGIDLQLNMSEKATHRSIDLADSQRMTALHLWSNSKESIIPFLSNIGYIEKHLGPVLPNTKTCPWQNLLDPPQNLHVLKVHLGEVWFVENLHKSWIVVLIKYFGDRTGLIAQLFGYERESYEIDHCPALLKEVDSFIEQAAKEVV